LPLIPGRRERCTRKGGSYEGPRKNPRGCKRKRGRGGVVYGRRSKIHPYHESRVKREKGVWGRNRSKKIGEGQRGMGHGRLEEIKRERKRGRKAKRAEEPTHSEPVVEKTKKTLVIPGRKNVVEGRKRGEKNLAWGHQGIGREVY